MGQTHPKSDKFKEFTLSFDEYENKQKISTSLLGIIKKMTHKKTHEEIFLREMLVPEDNSTINKYIEKMQKAMKLSHPHLLRIVGFNYQKEKNFCGSTKVIYLGIEKFKHTLLQKITKRKAISKYYEEPRVWGLLFQALSLLTYFQEQNHELGNISIKNVVSTGKGCFKFVDSSISQNTNILDSISHKENNCLSPEIFAQVSHKNPKVPDYDKSKSDIFSLGILFIQMCTLSTDTRGLYDNVKRSLNVEFLENKLEQVTVNYSDMLKCIISDMLRFSVDERPDANSLSDFLSEFEADCKAGRIIKNNELVYNESLNQSQYVNDISKDPINGYSSSQLNSHRVLENNYQHQVSDNFSISAKNINHSEPFLIQSLETSQNGAISQQIQNSHTIHKNITSLPLNSYENHQISSGSPNLQIMHASNINGANLQANDKKYLSPASPTKMNVVSNFIEINDKKTQNLNSIGPEILSSKIPDYNNFSNQNHFTKYSYIPNEIQNKNNIDHFNYTQNAYPPTPSNLHQKENQHESSFNLNNQSMSHVNFNYFPKTMENEASKYLDFSKDYSLLKENEKKLHSSTINESTQPHSDSSTLVKTSEYLPSQRQSHYSVAPSDNYLDVTTFPKLIEKTPALEVEYKNDEKNSIIDSQRPSTILKNFDIDITNMINEITGKVLKDTIPEHYQKQ